ncbi:hypothetical protein MNBD_BACTEROID05-493 [hydrothermal vent metagenome]|uniref:Uncharacterized protein n=1 Tax=hydrothermal vent metagenome TaxID=652676 RepID=A0A3B0TTD7_9ZZZZ
MTTMQNIVEKIQDRMQRGELTAAEANIELVLAERVRIVCKLSREVRKALNNAVKEGRLGHMKKDGLKPEVYYHPTFDYLARATRNKAEKSSIKAISSVLA